MQRAEREHRAAVTLGGRLLEQLHRTGKVARATAAVHQHLGQRDLGVQHVGPPILVEELGAGAAEKLGLMPPPFPNLDPTAVDS